MKCRNCGTEFNEGSFCPECGTEFIESERKEEVVNKSDVPLQSNEKKLGILVGAFLAAIIGTKIIGGTILTAWMIFSILALIFIEQRQATRFYQMVLSFSKIGWVVGFGDLFYTYSLDFLSMDHYVIKLVVALIIFIIIAENILPSSAISLDKIKIGMRTIVECFIYYIIALGLLAILWYTLDISFKISFVLSEIIYIVVIWGRIGEMKYKEEHNPVIYKKFCS